MGLNQPADAGDSRRRVARSRLQSVKDQPVQTADTTVRLQLDYPARVDFSVEHAIKRVVDVIGSLLLAVLFSPLIGLVLTLAAVSGQSAIFRHRRVGRDGIEFDCLKFQTMVSDAEAVLKDILARDAGLRAEWERDHKLANDPRVTAFGKFLRSTSLDELPQLWNVLKGEMSLVGPRPVTREELLRYGRNAVIYMMVRPGVTGLWQVSGRNNVEYRKRVAMDVCYVRKQSAVLDTWILFKTVIVVITRHGAY
jgi:lipopolysaccharide/colanic/teichoic acid biosynthesis glycosyltransferase